MLLYLLLAAPAVAVLTGIWVRSGPITATDDYYASVDQQLDRQAALIGGHSSHRLPWAPAERKVSRVAPRPVCDSVNGLVAS